MSATVDASLKKQKIEGVLEAPKPSTRFSPLISQTNSTLSIALENQTSSNTVYAYITGLALDNNNAVVLLQSDGYTLYFPQNPSSIGSPLTQNCAIALGGPGTTRTVTIPRIAGGRIWFSVNSPLTFLLNPGTYGPGLVEPSVMNGSDPNINTYWDFSEFTFDSAQIFANITYVDFVCLPIALTLTNTSGVTKHVSGIPANGLNTICAGLAAQQAADGAGWGNLIVTHNGQNLRALSPNSGIVINSGLFSGYYDNYVNDVWSRYSNQILTVDTQASWGNVNGEVSGNSLIFSGVTSYGKPSSRDIFSCNSGPFSNTAGEVGNISARICAAFNRTTLLLDNNEPNGENPANYYRNSPTNHYSRICHSANLDGLGYAFPYDDVVPSGGKDFSGSVYDGSPQLLTVTVGGANAHTKVRRRRALQFEEAPVSQKQLEWPMNEKRAMIMSDSVQNLDLEMGSQKVLDRRGEEERLAGLNAFALPPSLQRIWDRLMAKLPTIPESSRLRPIVDFLNMILVSLLSATARKFLVRLFCFVAVLVVYLVAERVPGQAADMSGVGVEVTPVNVTLADAAGGL